MITSFVLETTSKQEASNNPIENGQHGDKISKKSIKILDKLFAFDAVFKTHLSGFSWSAFS